MKLHPTKNTKETGIAIGHFGAGHWQHVDTHDGRTSPVGPIYLTKQEALANHEAYLVQGGWKKQVFDGKYTVILLRPEHLAEDFGTDTYTAHVIADDPNHALHLAREEVRVVDRLADDEVDDYALVVMFRGYLEAEAVE